jgi:hypothetical protein
LRAGSLLWLASGTIQELTAIHAINACFRNLFRPITSIVIEVMQMQKERSNSSLNSNAFRGGLRAICIDGRQANGRTPERFGCKPNRSGKIPAFIEGCELAGAQPCRVGYNKAYCARSRLASNGSAWPAI